VGVLTVRRREEERQQEMEEMEEMEEKDCLSQWIFPEHLLAVLSPNAKGCSRRKDCPGSGREQSLAPAAPPPPRPASERAGQ